MITEQINKTSFFTIAKAKDFAALAKFKLASLVVFSAFTGYMLAVDSVNWATLFWLIIGGFLVTGASNGFNQVIEKDLDKLMSRTQNRPIAAGRMSQKEGLIFSSIIGFIGLSILFFQLNFLSGVLGTLAMFLYTAVYTPMKRVSPICVLIGAVPGAIPPMLGWVAVTGDFGIIPGILFAVQFMWQFPHFWAIAWKLDSDYTKAGFKMLPSVGGKNKFSAFQILSYTAFMIPTGLLPTMFGISGWIAGTVATLAAVYMLVYAYKLYKTMDDKMAVKLMFASFIYLPIVQIIYFIDKV